MVLVVLPHSKEVLSLSPWFTDGCLSVHAWVSKDIRIRSSGYSECLCDRLVTCPGYPVPEVS